ncbi:hypothetical protein [Pantoea rwandensis]|uniref:Uncharacterized protein n=1 Tax=Pantoea rwandensis TaxID=1076550 RepID=A0A1X1CSE6_9GAMM|nr:hypothetical protein [Pantoea rwandensis]ORM67363.1 hypothetical protein HA51_19835 [Pantoea rwandensis]
MNRSDYQQIIDEIIGEATLALLQQAGPINTRALLEQLSQLGEKSEDPDRRHFVALAIKEVRESLAEGSNRQRKNSGVAEAESAHRHYINPLQSGSRQKH